MVTKPADTVFVTMDKTTILTRQLGLQPYETVWEKMKQFTLQRQPSTADELWLLQHPPVYTLGLNAKAEHLLDPGGIPVIHSDRGGEVSYHGPGQLVAYLLLDTRRRNLGIKDLVHCLEQSVIELLQHYTIDAHRQTGAPGVYVNHKKIAALGLRFKQKGCYHGLSLNVDMDLEPFSRINTCGYPGLESTQIAEWYQPVNLQQVSDALQRCLLTRLNTIGHNE